MKNLKLLIVIYLVCAGRVCAQRVHIGFPHEKYIVKKGDTLIFCSFDWNPDGNFGLTFLPLSKKLMEFMIENKQFKFKILIHRDFMGNDMMNLKLTELQKQRLLRIFSANISLSDVKYEIMPMGESILLFNENMIKNQKIATYRNAMHQMNNRIEIILE